MYGKRYVCDQLENFLCFSTRFQEDERLTVEQALNHMYFAGFDSTGFLEMSRPKLTSLFRIFIESEKTSVPQFYALNIFKLLCNYYIKGERWYMLESPFTNEEINQDEQIILINEDSQELNFLHYELGVDKDYLWTKLNDMINSNYQLLDT